jgi:tetrahydromethanopterin S-methyltransferase subunit F
LHFVIVSPLSTHTFFILPSGTPTSSISTLVERVQDIQELVKRAVRLAKGIKVKVFESMLVL